MAAPDGMLSGNLSSVGSDTLANLMALWGQDFQPALSQREPATAGCRFLNGTHRISGWCGAAWANEPTNEGGGGVGV
ncbi:Uncharacterised protein [Serratia fonticola]|uniref:Uncharacterized protein n=1 Tax=Serratia fonticola TaxID=47917 RepID=A0A4V6KPX3_SERFO|nr:Uncharacterised protein [Serratia fonticola]